jgi:outer membrane protein TolC
LPTAKSYFYPNINFSASVSRVLSRSSYYSGTFDGLNNSVSNTPMQVGINLSQPLIVVATWAQLSKANLVVAKAEVDLNVAKNNLILDAVFSHRRADALHCDLADVSR